MTRGEIKINLERMNLEEKDRYEGRKMVDVLRRDYCSQQAFFINSIPYTLDAATNIIWATNPYTVCASPEDLNR